MNHFEQLVKTVLSHTPGAHTFKEALRQWQKIAFYIANPKEEEENPTECACGYSPLKYVTTVENVDNGIRLVIGSKCIRFFELYGWVDPDKPQRDYEYRPPPDLILPNPRKRRRRRVPEDVQHKSLLCKEIAARRRPRKRKRLRRKKDDG